MMQPDIGYVLLRPFVWKRKSLWTRCLRWLDERRQQVQLEEMDERMLRDIGLTRGDVIRRVPFNRAREYRV
ncbi:DUF1127 domain-containing protein [Pollutimonas sp. H1-120]|uniref:DUF1127 domain-containing protein n=1 Tax=Pollutimonas sp. H1-120 TaxID=3148824 RepID=UPI003B51E2BB